jgi:hypothetical protein
VAVVDQSLPANEYNPFGRTCQNPMLHEARQNEMMFALSLVLSSLLPIGNRMFVSWTIFVIDRHRERGLLVVTLDVKDVMLFVHCVSLILMVVDCSSLVAMVCVYVCTVR